MSKVIISIDIGTTSSGFAFSKGSHSSSNGTKIPTILLLKLPKLEFVAFGPEAKQIFDDATPVQRQDYLYFANFKMALYDSDKKKSTEPLRIKAINNQLIPVDAIVIFTHCIAHMIQKSLEALNSLSSGVQTVLTVQNVQWILTVPSIWDPSANEIMKQAALKAGIPESKLNLLIESEAAAIYCRDMLDLPSSALKKDVKEKIVGQKTFLVIDLGGGTADFTVHRTVEAKHTNVIEVVAPSGGPWGGARVNDRFMQMLNKLFGESTMTRFNNESPHAFLELEQSFEQLKIRTHAKPGPLGQTTSCHVRLPNELIRLVPTLKTESEIELQWHIHEQQQEESQRIVTIDDYVSTSVSVLATASTPTPVISGTETNANVKMNMKIDQDDEDGDDDDFDDLTDVETEQMSRFLAEHKTNIWFCHGKLKFPWAMMLGFFSDVLAGIEQHTQQILKAHPTIDVTFLVGGFAQSTIVRDFLQDHVFGHVEHERSSSSLGDKEDKSAVAVETTNEHKLHFPHEPQQAVLFGAVMYGVRPRQIQSRIAQHNYGISATLTVTKRNRDHYKHEFKDVPRRVGLQNGKIKKTLEDIYLPLCKKGDALPIALPEDLKPSSGTFDDRIWKSVILTPVNGIQKSMTVHVYESERPERHWMSPSALSKKEVRLVGSVRIQLREIFSHGATNTSTDKEKERKLKVWFYFGDHAIKTCVVDSLTNTIEQSSFEIEHSK